MVIACWSAKGGSGTTVVAVALALTLTRREPAGVLLADLAGDAPAVLGVPEPDSPGLSGWLHAGTAVPADALARLEVAAAPGLGLLPRGTGELSADRAPVLSRLLCSGTRTVVADCGTLAGTPASAVACTVARTADRSLLILRPCYLSVRKAAASPVRPTGAVLVVEEGRPLGRRDVERTLGIPVVAQVPDDPAVARAVDAGLLCGKLPRSLTRAVSDAC